MSLLSAFYKAGGTSLWTVLGDYEASSEEGTKTFSFDAVDFDDDSYLVLEIDGDSVLAFNLLIL